MSQIRFLSDQIYKTGSPTAGPKFAAGSILKLADVAKAVGHDVTPEWASGFLDRWVKRNAAVYVDANAKPSEKAEAGDEKVTKAPEAKTQATGRDPDAGDPPPVIPDEKVSTVIVGDAVIRQPLGTTRKANR